MFLFCTYLFFVQSKSLNYSSFISSLRHKLRIRDFFENILSVFVILLSCVLEEFVFLKWKLDLLVKICNLFSLILYIFISLFFLIIFYFLLFFSVLKIIFLCSMTSLYEYINRLSLVIINFLKHFSSEIIWKQYFPFK